MCSPHSSDSTAHRATDAEHHANRDGRGENQAIRDARLKKLADAKEAERNERLATEDAAFVDERRRRYLASDPLATEDDFQRDLPEIRRQWRIEQSLSNGPTEQETAMRRANALRYGF